MIRLRKTISLIAAICILLAALPTWAAGLSEPAPAPAAEEISAEPEAPVPEAEPDDPEPLRQIYSGTCGADGDNLSWTLDTETGMLQISGSGAMMDYNHFDSSYAPWYSYRSYVKSAIISSAVTSIGNNAFYHCSSLTSVTIPDSVTSIGNSAFSGCRSLTSVTIPDSVTRIGDYAFINCSSLTSVNIYDIAAWCGISFSSYDSNPLYYAHRLYLNGTLVTDLVIPDSVTSIGYSAFSGCISLTSVTIPDSVTSIGNYAFYYCTSLTSVTIPDSVTSIGGSAFYYCSSLTSVTIPDSVTSIGDYAFYDCSSLTSVTIPDSVTSIGNYAFSNCTSLTSVTIGNGVTSIGSFAFRDCSSLTSAVFLGAPPTSFSFYIFTNCASVFTIYYTAAHASEWAPNGETDWDGYPIRQLGDGLYRVSFIVDTNEGNSELYCEQYVLPGSYVDKPEDPVREGYTFDGWYPNSLCIGQEWFDAMNNCLGSPINSNTCLFADWRPAKFDFIQDWYSFTNDDSYFYYVHEEECPKEKELITGEYYSALKKFCGKNNLSLWLSLNQKWGGSCLGMAATAALFKAGKLDTSFFGGFKDEDSSNVCNFKPPKENLSLRNLIEYYSLIVLSPSVTPETEYSNRESDNCKRIIEALESSNYPVVIGFKDYIKRSFGYGYKTDFYHAVLAYSYTISDDTYTIKIADPNVSGSSAGAMLILKIRKDGNNYENIGFSGPCSKLYDDGTDRYSFLEYAFTVENSAYYSQNIQDFLMRKGYSSGSAARSVEQEDAFTCLVTNFASFRINLSNGTYAVIEDGELIDGDLEIGYGECMNDIDYELQLRFVLPEFNSDESYTIVPAECMSSISGEPLEEYHASLVQVDSDGFLADASTVVGSEISFYGDGSVAVSSNENSVKSVTVCGSDTSTSWDGVTVDACDTKALVASPAEGAVAISADEDAEYDVTVSSFFCEVCFEGIVGGSDGVSVTEDINGNAVIVYNNSEDIVASGLFGHALIFCTMGAAEIETQSGIPYGGTATQPEDPVRPGMIFGGWYSTYECADGTEWSFDTPITEDTFIYAKWIIDENYMRLVTFRAEGCDDVSYLVLNGDALTGDVQPEIPEKEGYMAEWPEVDLSCITDDIVIEAVYTPVTASGACGDGVRWAYSNELGKLWIYGSGEMDDYSSANVPWYDFRSDVRNLEIAKGVTSIGKYAFYNFSSLTSVTIPDGVTSIGSNAFAQCIYLAVVTIPDGVTSIGYSAFVDCSSLTSVTISDGVMSIGDLAFAGCPLTAVMIPASVTSIGYLAFAGYSGLLASATFLGVPPTSFGSDVFYNCASDFTIYYTSDYASEWSPDGETTWNGYPIQMIGSPDPQTLLGDVNGDGEVTFADISALYSFLLGSSDIDVTLEMGDINADGEVTFADISALYDRIIS